MTSITINVFLRSIEINENNFGRLRVFEVIGLQKDIVELQV